jgi:hypothetical protein
VAAIKHPDLANAIDRMYEAAAFPKRWLDALGGGAARFKACLTQVPAPSASMEASLRLSGSFSHRSGLFKLKEI